MKRHEPMKFSNRVLMVITPLGVVIGLYEAWHLAGWLVALMAAQFLILGIVGVKLLRTARRELRGQQ